ncbi:MAG: helix-hairpin-helix domain-containing protein, partial [Calditrichota bacterium]
MKDPLQVEKTPFEILEIPAGAGHHEINQAYARAFGQRKISAAKVKLARDALVDPIRLTGFELLFYNEEALTKLPLNPLSNRELLERHQRAATLKLWERKLRETFPNSATTHCLAVGWFWWAQFEEERFIQLLKLANQHGISIQGLNARSELLSLLGKNGVGCEAVNSNHIPTCKGDIKDCPLLDECIKIEVPPLETMWRRVIGFWCALEPDDRVWRGSNGLSAAQAREVRSNFFNLLLSRLLNQGKRYCELIEFKGDSPVDQPFENIPVIGPRTGLLLQQKGLHNLREIKRGGTTRLMAITGMAEKRAQEILKFAQELIRRNYTLVEQYSTLEQELKAEMHTAEIMSSLSVRNSRGVIQCGPLMLQTLGNLNAVRSVVASLTEKNPDSKPLLELKRWLSEYSPVIVLLNNNKPEDALGAIDNLTDAQQKSQEVIDLRVGALNMLGNQYASLERYSEALECWASALSYNCAPELTKSVKKSLVDTCLIRANQIQNRQPDEAINLLEKALKIISDSRLTKTLVELLKHRANRTFKEMREKTGNDDTRITEEDMKQIKSCWADLDRAAKMGDSEAAEHAAIVKGIIDNEDIFSLPPEGQDLVRKARRAMAAKNWDEAINSFKRALALAGRNPPEVLRINLALALNNRGIARANQAMENLKEAQEKFNNLQSEIFGTIRRNAWDSSKCALKRENLYGSYYTITMNDGTEARLCPNCKAAIETLTRQKPSPSAEGIALLQSAYSDLSEAAQYNPSDKDFAKNKKEIADVLTQLGHTPQEAKISLPKPQPAKPTTPPKTEPPKPKPAWVKPPTPPEPELPKKRHSERNRFHRLIVTWMTYMLIIPILESATLWNSGWWGRAALVSGAIEILYWCFQYKFNLKNYWK